MKRDFLTFPEKAQRKLWDVQKHVERAKHLDYGIDSAQDANTRIDHLAIACERMHDLLAMLVKERGCDINATRTLAPLPSHSGTLLRTKYCKCSGYWTVSDTGHCTACGKTRDMRLR